MAEPSVVDTVRRAMAAEGRTLMTVAEARAIVEESGGTQHVADWAEAFPPLTPAQRDKISRLLRSGA